MFSSPEVASRLAAAAAAASAAAAVVKPPLSPLAIGTAAAAGSDAGTAAALPLSSPGGSFPPVAPLRLPLTLGAEPTATAPLPRASRVLRPHPPLLAIPDGNESHDSLFAALMGSLPVSGGGGGPAAVSGSGANGSSSPKGQAASQTLQSQQQQQQPSGKASTGPLASKAAAHLTPAPSPSAKGGHGHAKSSAAAAALAGGGPAYAAFTRVAGGGDPVASSAIRGRVSAPLGGPGAPGGSPVVVAGGGHGKTLLVAAGTLPAAPVHVTYPHLPAVVSVGGGKPPHAGSKA